MEQSYLKRHAGITLEALLKRLHKNEISCSFRSKGYSGKYFRETELNVDLSEDELRALFDTYDIIPSTGVATRRWDEERKRGIVECYYRFEIDPTEVDQNYVKITDEIAKRLKIDDRVVPPGEPMEIMFFYPT